MTPFNDNNGTRGIQMDLPLSPVPASSPSFFAAAEILEKEGIGIHHIMDAPSAQRATRKLSAARGPLGIDTETAPLPSYSGHKKAGLDPHLSRIRLVQLYDGGDTVEIFDMNHVDVQLLAPLMERPLVAHNAVFDLKQLIQAGLYPRYMGCTMLMCSTLFGRLASLANLTERFLGWEMEKETALSDWNAPELSEPQLAYAALDAAAVFRLFHRFKGEIESKRLGRTYTLMRNAQHAVAKMELAGIHFDLTGHAGLMETWKRRREKAYGDLLRLLGPSVNPSSGAQLSDWLKAHLDRKTLGDWPLTKTGKLKTDKGTLARHPDHPLVSPLLKYKEMDTLIATFGSGFGAHISPATGRIHASFHIGGTATGRLSCSGPNIQNPPRETAFRSLFSAPPGKVLVVADYGQIEMRVAALVSGDRNMLDAYRKGVDLHRKTASAVAGVPIEAVSREQRQGAKAVNFGLLYGQGARGLAVYAKVTYGVAMTELEAESARSAFFHTYPGLKRWQEKASRETEKSGRIVTPGGRVISASNRGEGGRGTSYTSALNTPIQGGAAEVLLAAMKALDRHLAGMDARLVNVVHDELVVEAAESQGERARKAVEAAMIEGMLQIFPGASTTDLVEAHVVSNWSQAK